MSEEKHGERTMKKRRDMSFERWSRIVSRAFVYSHTQRQSTQTVKMREETLHQYSAREVFLRLAALIALQYFKIYKCCNS